MEASRAPGGLGGWIRLTGKASWRVARVDFGLNMASAAFLESVTWHTSNVSVIDHTMSGGPNNTLCHNYAVQPSRFTFALIGAYRPKHSMHS